MAAMFAKLWSRLSTKRTPLSIMIIGLDNSGKTSILNILNSLDSKGGSQSNTRMTRDNSSSSVPLNPSSSDISPIATEANIGMGDRNLNVSPTAGYNHQRLQFKSLSLTVLDFSGQNRYRNLWQEFYNSVDGIVFVIDSSDLIRLVVVRDELETLLSNPYFQSLTKPGSVHAAAATVPISPELQQKQLTISQGKLVQSPLNNNLTLASTATSKTRENVSKPLTSAKGVEQIPRTRIKVPILFLANKTDLASSVDTEVIRKALNLNQMPIERHPWFIQATSVKSNQGIIEGFDWLANQLSAN